MACNNDGVMMKILAIIVTHNRCELLSRCLDYLLLQTRLPNEILVINNASEDGTVEMLERRGIKCITQDNLGSAGGWHRGIQYAMDHCFDAFWLMDDDGFPDSRALEILEPALVPGIACASSVVLCEEHPENFVFPFPLLDKAQIPVLLARRRKLSTLSELSKIATKGIYPFAHLFNGALISTSAAYQVGNVNQDFFMYGDELDYLFRLRKVGKVISVIDAIHFHPDVSKRLFTPIKVYYYIKNTMMLNKMYFNAIWLRHVLTITVAIYRVAKRNGMSMIFSLLVGSNAREFYAAILRGLQAKLGKDFNE